MSARQFLKNTAVTAPLCSGYMSSTGLVPLQPADRYLRILLILILVRSLTCHQDSPPGVRGVKQRV